MEAKLNEILQTNSEGRILFTKTEKARLLKLVIAEKDIITSNDKDKDALQARQLAWHRIAKNYNDYPSRAKRTATQLRQLFHNLKRNKELLAIRNGTDGSSQLSESSNYMQTILNGESFHDYNSDSSTNGSVKVSESSAQYQNILDDGSFQDQSSDNAEDVVISVPLNPLDLVEVVQDDEKPKNNHVYPEERDEIRPRKSSKSIDTAVGFKLQCMEKESEKRIEEHILKRKVLEMEYEAAKSKKAAYNAKREYYELKKLALE